MKMNGNSMCGKSKLMEEEGLHHLNDRSFHVAFVRPPSVYGRGCRGSYISGFKAMAYMLPIISQAFEKIFSAGRSLDNGHILAWHIHIRNRHEAQVQDTAHCICLCHLRT